VLVEIISVGRSAWAGGSLAWPQGAGLRGDRLAPVSGEAVPVNCLASKNRYAPPLLTSVPNANRSAAYD
jgi:hypothetical protein